jgi:hypothetical protein
MFRGNLAKTQGDIRESVSITKKFPKQKFLVRAFGSDISCKLMVKLVCDIFREGLNGVLQRVVLRKVLAQGSTLEGTWMKCLKKHFKITTSV